MGANAELTVSENKYFNTIPYSSSWKTAWDAFVISKARNGTIFHERNFLEYHPKGRFKDASLLFIRKKANPPLIEAVFPAVLTERKGIKCLSSHAGSSYGGLIFSPVLTTMKVASLLDQIIAHAKRLKAESIEIRLPENIIFSDPPDQEFSFLLWHRGFRLKTRELSSAVFLQSKIPSSRLSKKTYSWSVNRAISEGIKVSFDVSIENVYPLLESNLKNRYKKSPTHSLDELISLKERYPNRIKAWTAVIQKKSIAMVLTFETNLHVVHDFYIAQDFEYAKMQPLYLIFNTIFDYYRESEMKWFNFGISSRDKWIKKGILDFKEGLGGRGLIRETWILDNVYLPKPDDSPPTD
jgi:hypothetical protein